MKVRRTTAATLFSLLTVASSPGQAGSLPTQGKPAPDLRLKGLDGAAVELSGLRGRTVLLLFGELYNRNSVAAAQDVATVLAASSSADPPVSAFMIVTQDLPAAALVEEARRVGVSIPLLHDVGRRAFAGYEVMVLPSLVVIDARGEVVLPCPGYPMDFPALVSDAVLLASGGLSAGEFERRRSPSLGAEGSETHSRAARLASLGGELSRRGSHELAIAKFNEALTLDPDCLAARVGLGACRLAQGELALAEEEFQKVLASSPESVEGAVGLVRVQLIRGGSELRAAEENLSGLLRKHPNDPKVVYLAGVAAEKSGDADAALGRYKKAAELLLYGPEAKRDIK